MDQYRARERELRRMAKDQLARLHASRGGLMGVAVYKKWTKDELITAVLENEGYNPGAAEAAGERAPIDLAKLGIGVTYVTEG